MYLFTSVLLTWFVRHLALVVLARHQNKSILAQVVLARHQNKFYCWLVLLTGRQAFSA